MKLLTIFFFFGSLQNAFSFPENFRHGYSNCTTCHMSPTGGGLLSAYGRELSKEVQSTSSGENEHRFLYFLNTPEWLDLGGDLRSVQTFKNTPKVIEAKYILMQADVEGAATYKDLVVAASFGVDTAERPIDDVLSRRHYLMYRLGENITLRAGRFMRAYGIGIPDHTAFIKQNLGFNQGQETYNFEGSLITENWNLHLTGSAGRPDSSKVTSEKGISLSTWWLPLENLKFGPSFLYGTNTSASRTLYGLQAIYTAFKKFTFLTEWDLQSRKIKSGKANLLNQNLGFATFNRAGYEVFQGFQPFLVAEASKLNFRNSKSLQRSFGLGFQFFPRPHLDLQLQYLKQQRLSAGNAYEDYVNMVFHFYL
jgi:hypothetical protein